jgi:hypothetical protein
VVLQILAVVVPLLVAGLQAWRWPTLQRRVRNHVELMKELPAGVGADFRAAVEEELSALAAHSRRRMSVEWLSIAARIAHIAVLFGVATFAFFYSGGVHPAGGQLKGLLLYLIMMLLCFAALFLIRGLARMMWRDAAKMHFFGRPPVRSEPSPEGA